MADNVVSLNGKPVVSPGVSVDCVIKSAERLLEMAKAGEVVGVVWAAVLRDKCNDHEVTGYCNYSLLGAVEIVKTELIDALIMGGDNVD